MNIVKMLGALSVAYTAMHTSMASAEQLEFSVMTGQMYGSDLVNANGNDISIDSGTNIAFGVAWQKDNNGQGQILLNRVSHDFTIDGDATQHSLDVTYAHFNGIALFRQQNYVTTFSLGFGGAYLDAENGTDELYPSASIAFGTRYEFSENIALVTELRGYATLVDEKDKLFCNEDACSANFDNSVWIDTTISVGLAIKF